MWNRKLGRKADHRKALLRNMATSVILNGKKGHSDLALRSECPFCL